MPKSEAENRISTSLNEIAFAWHGSGVTCSVAVLQLLSPWIQSGARDSVCGVLHALACTRCFSSIFFGSPPTKNMQVGELALLNAPSVI